MNWLKNLFRGKEKETEKEILNNTVMAKKNQKIIISESEYFINDNRVKIILVQDPFYCVELTTFKTVEKKELAYEEKEIEEEIKIFELKRNEEENEEDYKKRKVVFDRIMLIRARGEKADMPEGFETQDKTAKIKKMAVIQTEKIVNSDKEDETKRFEIYFRPTPGQILELVRNYLNS